jgi:hypothetical protein
MVCTNAWVVRCVCCGVPGVPRIVGDPVDALANKVEDVFERVGRRGLREAREERGARVEGEAVALEGVRGAARVDVGLDDRHVQAVGGRDGAGAEPADAAPDHHHVVLLHFPLRQQHGGGRRASRRPDGAGRRLLLRLMMPQPMAMRRPKKGSGAAPAGCCRQQHQEPGRGPHFGRPVSEEGESAGLDMGEMHDAYVVALGGSLNGAKHSVPISIDAIIIHTTTDESIPAAALLGRLLFEEDRRSLIHPHSFTNGGSSGDEREIFRDDHDLAGYRYACIPPLLAPPSRTSHLD